MRTLSHRSALVLPVADKATRRRLSLVARRVGRALADPRVPVPPSWRSPEFARLVDEYRRQLAPHRRREGLAVAYAREAALLVEPAAAPVRAIDVAYALRWIETGPRGGCAPAWEPVGVAS